MSSIKYKEQVQQALRAMPRMTADEFYSQMSRSMGTPLKYIKMTNYTTTIGFRSKTEAIEQLCLKVFGATPVYGTDVEDFKAEASEEMTKLEVELNEVREQPAVSDPISIYAKYLECEIKDMKKELVTQRELAERLEEENADIYLRRWAKAQERAIDAERALKKAWYIMDTIEGNDAVDEWQNKYSKYIESDYISCLDCDALASHGVNDGPCEKHKKD